MAVVKRVWIVAALLSCILAIGTQRDLAHAKSGSDQARRSIVLPSVRASTDCITVAVSRQPGHTSQSPNAILSEAIRRGIAGGACDDAIERMVAVYDRTYGPGTGPAFFTGAYVNDLPRAVRSRLAGTATPTVPTVPTPPTISAGPINPLNASQTATQDRQAPSIAPRLVESVQAAPTVSAPLTA